MVSRVVTIVLLGATLTLAACTTVGGAAAEVTSAANCTQNAMTGRNC